jgi:hypothetical protein
MQDTLQNNRLKNKYYLWAPLKTAFFQNYSYNRKQFYPKYIVPTREHTKKIVFKSSLIIKLINIPAIKKRWGVDCITHSNVT